jgi:hypothetical protein
MALHPLSNDVLIIDQLSYHTAYGVRGGWHRIPYGRRQSHSFGEHGRPAAHQIRRRQLPPKARER